MTTPSQPRSVKISEDERRGWSSDRPRPGGGPPRPLDVSVRCRVLGPTDILRYTPGSLLLIVSASAAARDAFAQRLVENRASLMSLEKVLGLLKGRVADEEIEARAAELLDAAVEKRLAAGESVVLTVSGLDAAERERWVRMAAKAGRKRHLILLDSGRGDGDEDRALLNDLRSRLDAGELGAEGFETALRLGGGSASEVKRLVFRNAPKDD